MPHASPMVITSITFLYFVYVIQVILATHWTRNNWRSVLFRGSQVFVFFFCALAGYATSLLPDSYQGVREVLHWLLVVAALFLVVSGQGYVVGRMLTTPDKPHE